LLIWNKEPKILFQQLTLVELYIKHINHPPVMCVSKKIKLFIHWG